MSGLCKESGSARSPLCLRSPLSLFLLPPYSSLVYFRSMIDFEARLHHLIDEALDEDVGGGDHSTLCCIPADVKGKAVLKIKQDGILAGVSVADKTFRYKS